MEPDKRFWREVKDRKKMAFEFHDQQTALKTVNSLVMKMDTFAPEDVIAGSDNMRLISCLKKCITLSVLLKMS